MIISILQIKLSLLTNKIKGITMIVKIAEICGLITLSLCESITDRGHCTRIQVIQPAMLKFTVKKIKKITQKEKQ